MGLPPHSSRIMASGRCSGGGGWSSEAAAAVLGCLGGGGDDDDAPDNAPAEVVREVALEPASPTTAGETYEQHLALASALAGACSNVFAAVTTIGASGATGGDLSVSPPHVPSYVAPTAAAAAMRVVGGGHPSASKGATAGSDALCASALIASGDGGDGTRLPFAVDDALLQGAPGWLWAVRPHWCARVSTCSADLSRAYHRALAGDGTTEH